jgi:hypothetical protein
LQACILLRSDFACRPHGKMRLWVSAGHGARDEVVVCRVASDKVMYRQRDELLLVKTTI